VVRVEVGPGGWWDCRLRDIGGELRGRAMQEPALCESSRSREPVLLGSARGTEHAGQVG